MKNKMGLNPRNRRVKYSYKNSQIKVIRVPDYATSWEFLQNKHADMGLISRVLLCDDVNGDAEVDPEDLENGDVLFVEFA